MCSDYLCGLNTVCTVSLMCICYLQVLSEHVNLEVNPVILFQHLPAYKIAKLTE